MTDLISATWLKDNIEDPNIVPFDIRSPREYVRSHLPGAHLIPYEKILSFSEDLSFFDVAPQDAIEKLLSVNGITNDSVIVVYGDKNGATATRLFWSLKYYGITVKFLDTSFSKWLQLGYPVSEEVPEIQPTDFVITTPFVNFKVNHEYVQSKLSDSNSILLDTRSPDEFNGVIAAGPKAGRIPGSINFPWEIGVGTDGYIFKNIEELDKIFEKYGITKDKEIICYCQVGERASHTFVALQFCNYPNVKIYDRSFADWSTRADLPIEN